MVRTTETRTQLNRRLHLLVVCSGLWLGGLLNWGVIAGQTRADDLPQSPAVVQTPATAAKATAAAESEVQIQQWIGDLQSDQYVVRRQAFFKIWAQGAMALPQVRAALAAKDPTTAAAVRTLELLLRLEISPRDNDELAELANLTKGDISTTLVSLANKGHWRLARELLKNSESVWSNKQSDIQYSGLCRIVQAAFDQGDASLAWPAVSLLLEPTYRAYLPQRSKLSNPDYQSKNLELTAQELQSLPVDQQALHLLYAGQPEEAWALDVSSQTRFRIAMHSGRWAWLQDPALKPVVLGNTNDSLSGLAQQAAVAFLADDLAGSDRLLKKVQVEMDRLADSLEFQTTPELLDALSVCGDGASLARLLTTQPNRKYLNYYKSAMRYELGLQAFGLSADMELAEFQNWTKRMLQKIPRNAIPFGNDSEVESYCDLATYLVSLGMTDHGRHLYQKLVEYGLNQGAQQRYETLYYVIRAARQSQLRSTLLQEFDRQDNKINAEVRKLVTSLLWSGLREVSESLWSTIPDSLARVDQSGQRWQVMDRISRYDRRLVEEPEQAKLMERWLENALAEGTKNAERSMNLGPQLAELAIKLGLQRATQNILRTSASRATPDKLASVLVLNNNLETASKLWERAIAQDPSQHSWIRQQITTLRLLGEPERAAQYEETVWLRPLRQSPTERSETYVSLAREFFDQGNYQLARQYGQAATTLFDFNQSDLTLAGELLSRINMELEDFPASAHAIRLALINVFMSRTTLQNASDLDFEFRIYIAGQDYLMRTAADIEAGRIAEAMERARRFETLRPGGIEICEHCYPRLLKAGANAEAQQMLNSWTTRMREHLQQWPNDAGYHNNYAWMLARCNTQIDQAREHAELAVKLSERDPTYVDTLAEIEFRQGHIDKAIDLAKECIASDPSHAHYQSQLHRFRTEVPPELNP